MDGEQAQGYLRSTTSGMAPEDQERFRRASNDYRSIPDPARVVDGYVNPCTNCEAQARAMGVPVDATELEKTYAQMGGDIRALRQTTCFMDKYKNSQFHSDYNASSKITIGDQCKFAINEHAGRGNRGNKMFLVNRCSGEIKVMNVTRGNRGIGNDEGQTTPGFHLTAGWHNSPSGKIWSPGIKMIGLQQGINNRAFERGVVMHRAFTRKGQYCSGGVNSSRNNPKDVGGDCGNSNGCPAVQKENWGLLTGNLLGSPQAGNVIYNYTNREKNAGNQYCGDRLKLVGN